MKNILRTGIISGLFITPIIPFIVLNSTFFPFITGKAFVFRIIVEILFGAWIVLMLQDVSYRPKKSKIFWAVTVFVGVIALADLLGVNFYRSFWSNYERMEGLFGLLHLFAYFIMLCTMLNVDRLWTRFFNTTLVANAILCVFYGLPQAFGSAEIHQGSVRLDATLGNSAYFAVYLLLHTFIAIFLLLRSKNVWMKMVYGVSIFLQGYLLYLTQTRGAIIGLAGGLFVSALLIAIFEREKKTLRAVSIGIIVTIIAFTGVLFMFKDSKFVESRPTLQRLAGISLSKEFLQGQGRYYIWPMAIKGFKERPVLGWGQENFNYVFNKNYNPNMYAQEQWFDRTHNVVLDWLIAGGLLGVLSYLSIFFAILYCLWKNQSDNFSLTDKAILTGMLLAHFFQNLFVFDNLVSYMLFFMIGGYVYAMTIKSDAPSFAQQRVVSSGVSERLVAPLVIVVLIGVLYMGTIKPILANTTLLDALAPEAGGVKDISKDIESFKKSLSYNTFGSGEAREQLVILSQNLRTNTQVPDDVKKTVYDLATTEMEKQIKEGAYPDARYYLFLGSLLGRYGALGDALSFLTEANRLSPGKQSIYFEIANVYLLQGKSKEALETSKFVFDLAPEYQEARIRYFLVLMQGKNLELAREVAKGLDPQNIIFDNRILGVFADAKDFNTVFDILKKRIASDPKNAQYITSLAAAYLQAGQRQQAVKTLQECIDVNPTDCKAPGEYYIKEIQAGRNP